MTMDAPDDFTAFWRVEWPRIVGALTLYTGDPQLAEDLTQETAVRTARDWADVSTLAAPGAWAYRVALNLARSRFRRERVARRARHRLARSDEATDPDPADAVAVRTALAQLPPRERDVIVMRSWLDLTEAQIATALRVPDGTVKTLSRRALARLREKGLFDADPTEASTPFRSALGYE